MGLLIGSNAVKSLCVGDTPVRMVYLGDTKVWPIGLPAGTVYNFEYTGQVQSIELPPGKYKLLCWGAQGGTSYPDTQYIDYSFDGSLGGYSQGILTLTETTTLYVFVGGEGYDSNSYAGWGGWNGGGNTCGTCEYTSASGLYGISWPAAGGGATDIALVSSNMANGRSLESLLSRIIVAGGGAGASSGYYEWTTSAWSLVYDVELNDDCNATWENTSTDSEDYGKLLYYKTKIIDVTFTEGETVKIEMTYVYNPEINDINVSYWIMDDDDNTIYRDEVSNSTINSTLTWPAGGTKLRFDIHNADYTPIYPGTGTANVYSTVININSETDSTSIDQGSGGGEGGFGYHPGWQNDGYAFGVGESLDSYSYMHCGGAGGGGWYGGGTNRRDSDVYAINYGSGGSGFVNIAANAAYRPSGYTGLLLDSGITISHYNAGHGRAKITVLNEFGEDVYVQFLWSNQEGSWTPARIDLAADGYYYTSDPLDDNGSAITRCTFNGVTSITFLCSYDGENNFDYLTVGNLDLSCTRDSYGTTLKGNSGTARDITFTCDKGEHFVEFCYSKDSSVSEGSDNAQVYIKSYTT